MYNYNVTLYTDGTPGEREVKKWIATWNDSAGGRWQNLKEIPNNRWTVSLEVNRSIEPEIKGVIAHTIGLNEGLADWGYVEG